MKQLSRPIQIAMLMFVIVFAASFVFHWALWLPFGNTLAIGTLLSLSHTYMLGFYHISYLLAESLTLALIGTTWLVILAPRIRKHQRLQIAAIPPLALLLAGLLCSIIWRMRVHWVLYDTQPVSFPTLRQLANYTWSGIGEGLTLAPLIAVRSFPWNVLWYGFTYLLIVKYKEWLAHADSVSSVSAKP